MRLMTAQSTSLLCLAAMFRVDPSRQGGQCCMCGYDSEGGRLCHDHELDCMGGDGVYYWGRVPRCRLRRFCHSAPSRRSMWLCTQFTVMVLEVLAQCKIL